MKFYKYIIIAFGTIILGIFATGIYFAGALSATYPPLKKYYFNNSIPEFENRLKYLKSHYSCEINITDTTGHYPNDYNINLTICDATQKEYYLKYRIDKSYIHDKRLEFSLVGAFDRIKNTGGYKKSEKDIEFLIDFFEKNILTKINHN